MNEHTKVFENGLKVCIIDRKGYNEKLLKVFVKAGSLHEHFIENGVVKKCINGTAHFLEHKIFNDIDKDATEYIAKLGGNVNAQTELDNTIYEVAFTENTNEIISELFTMLSFLHVTKETLEAEKSIISNEEHSNSDKNTKFYDKAIYGKNAKRVHGYGSQRDIKNMTLDSLYTFYNTFYKTSNITVFLAADVNVEETMQYIYEQSKKLNNEKLTASCVYEEDKKNLGKIFYRKQREDYSRVDVVYKLNDIVTISEKMSLAFAIDIINSVCFTELSDKYMQFIDKQCIITSQDLDYDLYDTHEYISTSYFVKREQEDKTKFLKYLNIVRNSRLTKEEFNIAKKYIIGANLKASESIENISYQFAYAEKLGMGIFAQIEMIEKITIEQVHDIIYKAMNPKNRIVIVNI